MWRSRVFAEVPVGLSWVLGLSTSFLAVGIAGLFAADRPLLNLKATYDKTVVEELPLLDAPMAELATLEAPSEPAPSEEPAEELPPEIPEPAEMPPPELDLPEIAEALTEKDIFAIPTAPKIEDALKPVDPVVKPQPRPSPTPRKSTTVARSSGTPGTGATSGGATGGTRRVIQSSPPYPSFARASGMQGTVTVSITFAPSGYVSSVRVTGTSGFSALDQYAADHVRRTFRATPHATSSTYSKRFSFRLR